MKRFKDWCRFTLVSPEAIWALLCYAVYIYSPAGLESLGKNLQGTDDSIKVIFGLPALILTFNFAFAKVILFPSEALKKELKLWPDYQGLWDRTVWSITISFVSTGLAGVLWVWRMSIAGKTLVIATVGCIGISAICLFCLGHASLMIKRITDEFEK